MALTIEKLKEKFASEGKTLAQWARDNGYKPRDVYLVIGGQNKAKYGKGFEIAQKLGLK
ncbi:DNA-binding protein [Simonsiella muelleri]|uniref:DNA-binding protein n=1 Tax=Simonsiella muelleri TaxID=72 RepID=UPI0028D878C2|nr:DNA-binding protein [Simonsiella muelleri]